MNDDFIHIPILSASILDFFSTTKKKFFLDCTAGEGGHTFQILEKFPDSRVYMIDRDPEMVERALMRNREQQERIVSYNTNFSDPPREILLETGGLDGILLDFGISMYHIKKSERGFSFRGEEPLDMRLDGSSKKTASIILNTYKKEELLRIFLEYGEEKWSKKIVEVLLDHRRKNPIQTNKQLTELIERIIPKKFWPPHQHPASRIYQALRIEVNRELDHIAESLPVLASYLAPGGIICCISFHSLEDRVVKLGFKELREKNILEILTKKPILPDTEEVKENPASRSAKLRVGKKMG